MNEIPIILFTAGVLVIPCVYIYLKLQKKIRTQYEVLQMGDKILKKRIEYIEECITKITLGEELNSPPKYMTDTERQLIKKLIKEINS